MILKRMLLLLAGFISFGVQSFGAPPSLEEWKTVKSLKTLTIPWPAPDDRYKADDAEHVQLTRILGAISVNSEYTTKAQTLAALSIAQQAETLRGSPIKLGVLFLPWKVAVAPDSAAAHAEFYRAYQKWLPIKAALAASAYKPGIVVFVDTETFDARTEPARSQVADLYSAYDAFLRAITGCTQVEWYGWAEWPGPCDPDGWCTQPWAVPFDGLKTLSVELYGLHEIGLAREATRRARSMADSLGLSSTTAWVSAPGCGQRFTFEATFQEWVWDIGQDTRYSGEMGRELYQSWYCARPSRFMACPATAVFYPHPFDPRIVDPDRKHLMAMIAATE
jgi:hypothetical protein